MPKFKNDDEAKAQKRKDNERQLTIVMMIYIGKWFDIKNSIW